MPFLFIDIRLLTYWKPTFHSLWRKVPDPILGPKGVRHLLAIRGFTGYVSSLLIFHLISPNAVIKYVIFIPALCSGRFFGLFGVYYSLQYLSLSDATVLTFLAPLTTAVSGYFFLGEAFHKREALAGCACHVSITVSEVVLILGMMH